MKKILIFYCLFFALKGFLYSQELKFCEDVSENGYCYGESNRFTCSSYYCKLWCYVELPYYIGTYSAKYVIYKVNSYGVETYYKTEYQYFSSKYIYWFAKQITFYTFGKYRVYVYDGNGYYLVSRTLYWE